MGLNIALNTKFNKAKYEMPEEDRDILTTLKMLKTDLDYVHNNLDYVTDPVLIDSYIYEIKAIQMKYKYYLGICKERGIVAGF